MARKQINIHDIAEKAGVSIATVSRVLSGGVAGEASRRKVEAAVAALGYESNNLSRRLAGQSGRSLLLMTTDVVNPYYSSLCQGAEAAARRGGYSLQLVCRELEKQMDEATLEQILSLPVDGAILVGSAVENGTDEQLLSHLLRLRQRMPIVTIGPRIEGLSCVNITSDLSVSIRKSISHLIQLGHRRICYIGGSSDSRSYRSRRESFIREITEHGLELLVEDNCGTGFSPRAGEICTARLLSRLSEENRPTALIAANDLVALGALRQLQRMGLRVPEDMALIGCDNQFFTPYLTPPLTTVDLHPEDHGRCAAEELIRIIGGSGDADYSQIRECSLIVRESCGALLGARNFG